MWGKIFVIFVVEGLTTNILPTNEATLPVVQTLTTKILPTKCLKIAEPQIFCPPKITRYTVFKQTTNTRGAHAPRVIIVNNYNHNYLYMYNVHVLYRCICTCTMYTCTMYTCTGEHVHICSYCMQVIITVLNDKYSKYVHACT